MAKKRSKGITVRFPDEIYNKLEIKSRELNMPKTKIIEKTVRNGLIFVDNPITVILSDVSNEIEILKDKVRTGERIRMDDINLVEEEMVKIWQLLSL